MSRLEVRPLLEALQSCGAEPLSSVLLRLSTWADLRTEQGAAV